MTPPLNYHGSGGRRPFLAAAPLPSTGRPSSAPPPPTRSEDKTPQNPHSSFPCRPILWLKTLLDNCRVPLCDELFMNETRRAALQVQPHSTPVYLSFPAEVPEDHLTFCFGILLLISVAVFCAVVIMKLTKPKWVPGRVLREGESVDDLRNLALRLLILLRELEPFLLEPLLPSRVGFARLPSGFSLSGSMDYDIMMWLPRQQRRNSMLLFLRSVGCRPGSGRTRQTSLSVVSNSRCVPCPLPTRPCSAWACCPPTGRRPARASCRPARCRRRPTRSWRV